MIQHYAGLNLGKLQLLGQGTQGKVYRIDLQRCIKVFKSTKVCKNELETLLLAQGNEHFPKLYGAGENYIIRECVNGIELNKFLSMYPLTPLISYKIIQLYDAMFKVGFTRLDSAIFHIFVTSSYDLRLIDTAKALKKKTIYPHLIIHGLDKLGYKDEFLNYIMYTRPDLFNKWSKYIK